MEAAERKGRKKSIRQQWRARSSSRRRECGGRGKALGSSGEETVSRRQRWKRQARGGENPATGRKTPGAGPQRRQAAPWLAVQGSWQLLCAPEAPVRAPLGHSPARRWHLTSTQRPGEGPSLIRARLGTSLSVALLPPGSRLYYMDPTTQVAGMGSCNSERGGALLKVTKLAGSSISP